MKKQVFQIENLVVRVVIVLISISTYLSMHGQSGNTNISPTRAFDNITTSTLDLDNFRKLKTEDLDYSTVRGNPYYFPDYVSGQLVTTTGDVLDEVEIKYDLFSENFVANKNGSDEIFVDTRYCREIIMSVDGEEIIFKRANPSKPNKFYHVLFENKTTTVFKDVRVGITQGQSNGITQEQDRFYKKEQYYVSKYREIYKVKRKKKDLWKYFNEEEVKMMEQFLKKNKLKLKSDKAYRAMLSVLKTME